MAVKKNSELHTKFKFGREVIILIKKNSLLNFKKQPAVNRLPYSKTVRPYAIVVRTDGLVILSIFAFADRCPAYFSNLPK